MAPDLLTGALAAGRAWRIGEDPFHISVMGSAAYEGLQSPRPVPGGQPTDRFLATRATVPYYLGYHGGSMDPKGSLSAFNATKRSLADSYWPAYGALLESVSQSTVFWALVSPRAQGFTYTDVHASRSVGDPLAPIGREEPCRRCNVCDELSQRCPFLRGPTLAADNAARNLAVRCNYPNRLL
eukprot:COSAG02_NODE_5624_length_4175_cov_1.970069_4_plen_183_part_00